ncbi:hypothetical protein JZ751_000514 [Albula glossodonta]|uniref:Uncharacterized protein n=1 Tax=Albula glossodonta TaxID=121402 RepID=A0A8T2PWT1_9TELE|nr:hypothetical protein JZ751_000514 [Albula glossodonta]
MNASAGKQHAGIPFQQGMGGLKGLAVSEDSMKNLLSTYKWRACPRHRGRQESEQQDPGIPAQRAGEERSSLELGETT